MNYTQYLQGGDSIQTPMSDEQALAMLKQKDAQAAEAIKSNPSILDEAIQDYGEDAPAFIKHMIDVAAENQDEQLLEILKPYAEKFNISAFRCGGKVRAKIKKAKCGKKMEKGGETLIKKEAKGGKPCPCTLHKVGGKLIEVDCNGIPVAKNGAVLYAKPGDQLPSIVDLLKDNKKQQTITKAMWSIPGYGQARNWNYGPENYGSYFGDQFISKTGTYNTGQVMYRDMQETNQNDPGFNYIYSSTRPVDRVIRISDDGKTYSREHLAPGPYREVTTEEQLNRERNAFGAGKQGKFGGLTYDEALARQNEMQSAKAQGFNVDLGRWGADGKWGNQSRSEWERYQQWKADQELAALKAQNSGLLRIESSAALNPTRITVDNSTTTAPLAVTRNGDIVRISSLTPGQALSQLNAPAWEEYTRRLRQGILSSKNGGKMSYADYLK